MEVVLPVIVSSSSIGFFICCTLISGNISIIRYTSGRMEVQITRQSTKEVHDAIDTEVVAVLLVLGIAFVTRMY